MQPTETRRRYGWLRMVFQGARLFRAPIWCPSGGVAARERQGTLSRRAYYSSALSGGYASDSAKAEGSSIVDEPGEGCTPVGENKGREPGGFWGKSLCLTTVIFLPTRVTRSGERARFVGLFQGCTGLRTAGCWFARRLHQLKASTTMWFLPIHSGHQVRWTYQPGSHRTSHPPFSGGRLNFSREKDSAIPFPRRL